ncbi:MAG: oligosaccharide flippase family protein [Candidatus Bathyarchaeia archaeon]
MDKATEMGKTSALGSVHLFLGVSISTIILAVGTIILGLYILPGDYGLYVVALIPITTLALFQDWGIGSALTRYCAKYRATNEEAEQRKVIIAGLIFGAATGLALTVVSLLLANFFATTIYHKPASAFLITLASFTILSGAINSGTGSIFTGFEQMKLNSYLDVIYAATQGVLAPLLVYLGYGAKGAILGFTSANVVQTVISIIFLYFFIFRKLPHSKTNKSEVVQTLKSLLSYSFPLGIGNIVSSLGGPFFSFLMAYYVSTAEIGNYKIATNFLVLLTFLTIPISNVLFPAFSKLDPRNENSLLKTVFTSSVKYTALLVVPATLALMVLAKPLIGTLYGNKWSYAPPLLALSVVYNLLSLLGWRSMGSLLPAVGETKLLMKLAVMNLAMSIPLAFILVPWLGIIGLIIGSPVSTLPSTFIALYLIWKHYGTKADFGASAKILLASALSTVTVYLFLIFFTAPYWVLLVAGSFLFLAVYLISAPFVGAIKQSDINNLRTMFSSLGIISKVSEIPLKLIEKILKTRNPQDKTKNQ